MMHWNWLPVVRRGVTTHPLYSKPWCVVSGGAGRVFNLGINMNIELEEVVQDVSDEALELAAGGAQGGALRSAARCVSVLFPEAGCR